MAFVTTLTLAMTAAVLLQVVFGALGPFLTESLDLSRTRLGLLTTALYLSGSLLSPAAGRVVDGLGARRPLAALLLLKVAGIVIVVAAPSFELVLLGALIGGVAIALANPITNLLIALHTPSGRQGVVTGVKQSGVQLGVFVGGAALPPVAEVAGWRTATAVCLLVPLGTAATAWLSVPPDPPRRPRAPGAPAVQLPPGIVWLTAYAIGMGTGIAAIGAHLPLYGVERLGLPAAAAGLLTAVVGGVGVAARIGWGRLADRSSTPPAQALALMGVIALVAAGMILAAEGWGVWFAWAGAVLAGASAAAWNAVGMLAIIRDADVAVAGRASGIVLLSFYFGFVVGPPAFGLLVDATGAYAAGWGFVLAVCGSSGVVAQLWRRRPG